MHHFAVMSLLLLLPSLSNAYSDVIKNVNLAIKRVEANPDFWPNFNIDTHPIIIMTCPRSGMLAAYHFKPTKQNWQIEYDNVYTSFDIYSTFRFRANDENKGLMQFDGQTASVLNVGMGYNSSCHYTDTGSQYFQTAEVLNQAVLNYLLYEAPGAEQRYAEYSKQWEDISIYKAYNIPDMDALIYLETLLLNEYSTSHNEETLKEYLAVDISRKAFATPESIKYENWYMYENAIRKYIACYTYTITSGPPEGYIAIYLNAIYSRIQRNYDSTDTSIIQITGEMLEYLSSVSVIARDQIAADWKTQLSSSNNVIDMLQRKYMLSSPDVTALTDAAKNKYNYPAILENFKNHPQY